MSCRRALALLAVLAGTAGPLAAQKVIVNAKLEDLQAAALKDSCDPAAHYNLAMGYWSKKNYVQADSSLRRAIAIDAQFADAYLALSVVHSRDGDFRDRIRKERGDSGFKRWEHENESYATKAYMLDPLVDIRILGAITKTYGSNRVIRAFENLYTGKYQEAYTEFSEDMAFFTETTIPDSVPPLLIWFHSLTAARTGNYGPAIQDLDVMARIVAKLSSTSDVPDLSLTAAEIQYMKASYQLKSGAPGDALKGFQFVASLDAGNYMAHVQMARIYESVRDYPKALAERTNALNINPEDASLMLDRGITLGKSGDMAQAETQLEQAEEANPRDTRILFWLGIAQAEQGKKDSARDSFNAFLSRAPSRFDRQIAMAHDRLAKL
ncbi:MAG TPA: tetratricopeptide repeat protein [Gemmatimonadales bacterium]|nr:tetratricopeptide repeat protein [Gemmatimonadales bacterium]